MANNNAFRSLRSKLAYAIAFGFIGLGVYLVVFHNGLERTIGFAGIAFFSALVLMGLTKQKKQP